MSTILCGRNKTAVAMATARANSNYNPPDRGVGRSGQTIHSGILVFGTSLVMYVHLNKKIAIPNCPRVRCVAWSVEHDFIGCGGENGMLKVIKLDPPPPASQTSGGGGAGVGGGGEMGNKNLSLNQSLDSHKATVECVCWNEPYQKLTSSDANGTIIVWMFYKGMWYEEMVNNRQKSLVTGMAWTHDGQKICIVYEDGAIITGSVDGSRLWGKEMKNFNLHQVEWSPDGKVILIGTKELDIHILDQTGNVTGKVMANQRLVAMAFQGHKAPNIVAIRWYKGGGGTDKPGSKTRFPLVIGYTNGQLQWMRNEGDEQPALVDADMEINCLQWNRTGEMLALTGIFVPGATGTAKNILKIYNNQAEPLAMIKVPGVQIYGCSWDRSGLKMVLAVDGYIYFAGIKPKIMWRFISAATVVSYCPSADRQTLVCWQQTPTNRRYEWRLDNGRCHLMAASSQYLAVVVASTPTTETGTSFRLHLYNGTGTLVDHHSLPPDSMDNINHCCMNSTIVVVASGDSFYLWTFKPLYNHKSINETLVLATTAAEDGNKEEIGPGAGSPILASEGIDPITAITASDKYLLVGHESGRIDQYLLPGGTRLNRIQMMDNHYSNGGQTPPARLPPPPAPNRMELNRNSSRLALIDRQSKLHIYDFDANNETTGTDGKWLPVSTSHGEQQQQHVKQQDIWDMAWAADHNDLIVVQDRSKLVVINLAAPVAANTAGSGWRPETTEPIASAGYICRFHQLSIQTVMLDQVLAAEDANQININDYVDQLDCQYVRKIKDLIAAAEGGDRVTEAINYALSRPDLPYLWTVLARECLHRQQIETAYLAMVKCRDYCGLQFLKRLNKINDEQLERAEILAYQNRFEEAEQLYLDLDRADLALHLNKTTGNHQRVFDLLQKHRLPNHEKELDEVHRKLGEYHSDHYRWKEAAEHFEMIGNNHVYDQLAECYMNLERYDSLITLIPKVQHDRTLIQMAVYFELSGFARDAVKAYIRAGQFESAIQTCVNLSEWKLATELANQYQTKNIDRLLERYVQHLEASGSGGARRYMEIIEVYRKANRPDEAVAILVRMIGAIKCRQRRTGSNEAAAVLKKLYVLIGLLYEENRKSAGGKGPVDRQKDALNQLLMPVGASTTTAIAGDDISNRHSMTAKTLEDPWKGAEAYHFFLLAQRYVYRGDYNLAMSTALHLEDYEEYLTGEQIYSMIALTSLANKCFHICSKAFIKLESLSGEFESSNNHHRWNSLLGDLIANNDDGGRLITTDDGRRRHGQYEELAVEIFLDNPPTAAAANPETEVSCKYCNQLIPDYSVTCGKCQARFVACVASGKSIVDPKNNWTCPRCQHRAIQAEISSYDHCPLCHFKF